MTTVMIIHFNRYYLFSFTIMQASPKNVKWNLHLPTKKKLQKYIKFHFAQPGDILENISSFILHHQVNFRKYIKFYFALPGDSIFHKLQVKFSSKNLCPQKSTSRKFLLASQYLLSVCFGILISP